MRLGPESQYFSGAAREVNMADGEDVLLLANILLRHVDDQILAGKSEVRPAPPFHVLGGSLRQRGDYYRQSNGRVTIYEGGKRASSQFSVDQRLVEGDSGRAPTGMRGVSRDRIAYL